MSFKRFFNCPEFSDCTLEIVEETGYENGVNETEEPVSKKIKIEVGDDVTGSTDTTRTISCLYIHSLLFCSKSEFFQSLLSKKSGSEQKNIRIVLSASDTEHFLRLIHIIYDDSRISQMSLAETTPVLKLAHQFKCVDLQRLLLVHLSKLKIHRMDVFEDHMAMFNTYFSNHKHAHCWKKSLLQFTKEKFCPLEKVFGHLLEDFLKLRFTSLLFLLTHVTTGIAVHEETVVSLLLYWLKHARFRVKRVELIIELLDNCHFEHVSCCYLLNVFKHFIEKSNETKLKEFYTNILEEKIAPDYKLYFPSTSQKSFRCLNFAHDHEAVIFFSPNVSVVKSPLKREDDDMVTSSTAHYYQERSFTCGDDFIMFTQGYQLRFNAGIFLNDEKKKELKVQIIVDNYLQAPHSPLHFLIYYAIASPSVSHEFSPWNHCLFTIGPMEKQCWKRISYVADHSYIHEAGFYLKLNFM